MLVAAFNPSNIGIKSPYCVGEFVCIVYRRVESRASQIEPMNIASVPFMGPFLPDLCQRFFCMFLGEVVWKRYPTMRCLMEMVMTK